MDDIEVEEVDLEQELLMALDNEDTSNENSCGNKKVPNEIVTVSNPKLARFAFDKNKSQSDKSSLNNEVSTTSLQKTGFNAAILDKINSSQIVSLSTSANDQRSLQMPFQSLQRPLSTGVTDVFIENSNVPINILGQSGRVSLSIGAEHSTAEKASSINSKLKHDIVNSISLQNDKNNSYEFRVDIPGPIGKLPRISKEERLKIARLKRASNQSFGSTSQTVTTYTQNVNGNNLNGVNVHRSQSVTDAPSNWNQFVEESRRNSFNSNHLTIAEIRSTKPVKISRMWCWIKEYQIGSHDVSVTLADTTAEIGAVVHRLALDETLLKIGTCLELADCSLLFTSLSQCLLVNIVKRNVIRAIAGGSDSVGEEQLSILSQHFDSCNSQVHPADYEHDNAGDQQEPLATISEETSPVQSQSHQVSNYGDSENVVVDNQSTTECANNLAEDEAMILLADLEQFDDEFF